jgi:hypothetical protein
VVCGRGAVRASLVPVGGLSATGHLQTWPAQGGMSASPLKADISACGQHVLCGPDAVAVGHPFGSEKVLGRKTIVEMDAMPQIDCKA